MGNPYVLQVKQMTPPPVPPQGTPPPLAEPPAMGAPEPQGRQWAGEEYTLPDAPTGPEGAYAVFHHPSGDRAWLSKDDSGVITGWVMTVEGTLMQYMDPQAWALDVDGAEMAEVDQGVDQSGDMSEEDELSTGEDVEDPMGDGDLGDGGDNPDIETDDDEDEAGDEFTDEELAELEDIPDDDLAALDEDTEDDVDVDVEDDDTDESFPFGVNKGDNGDDDDDDEEDDDDDDDDDEDEKGKKVGVKFQRKSLVFATRPVASR